jgi:hypothetical protein
MISFPWRYPSTLLFLLPWIFINSSHALNILLPGGTGNIGKALASQLSNPQKHDITILTRNAFLAATPSRVTEDFGWVGASFMQKFPNIQLRDWDGGDLLDIVGDQWLGWQDDALQRADVVVHLTGGGFTPARVMACERLVRETLALLQKKKKKQWSSPQLHITVNPTDELLQYLSPGLPDLKKERIQRCEDLVSQNLPNYINLRIPDYKPEVACQPILKVIEDWEQQQQQQS